LLKKAARDALDEYTLLGQLLSLFMPYLKVDHVSLHLILFKAVLCEKAF